MSRVSGGSRIYILDIPVSAHVSLTRKVHAGDPCGYDDGRERNPDRLDSAGDEPEYEGEGGKRQWVQGQPLGVIGSAFESAASQ